MKKGKLIVIDGGEGAGKSTQLNFLREVLAGQDVLFTREPGGTPIAEELRKVILSNSLKEASGKTQMLNFWAARSDHVEKLIRPSLEKGIHIITDRFDSSSYAYQIYGQEEPSLEELFFKIRENILKETVPDLYIFLEVSPEVGLARVSKRAAETQEQKNHFDDRKVDFHRKLTEGYKAFLKKFPHRIINAEQPIDLVKTELLDVILSVLKR